MNCCPHYLDATKTDDGTYVVDVPDLGDEPGEHDIIANLPDVDYSLPGVHVHFKTSAEVRDVMFEP